MNNRKEKRKFFGFSEEIPLQELILFCIFNLQKNKEDCTFERLVKECFALFPRVCGFVRYSRWPDSRKIDRPLRTLRKKKLIAGNPKTFFVLTDQGKKEAIEIEKILTQKKLF